MRLIRSIAYVALLLIVFGHAQPAWPSTTDPGSTAGSGSSDPKPPPTHCTVLAVQKHAQYREAKSKPWKRINVGDRIPLSGEIRVGLRSSVVLQLGNIQKTVDRLSMFAVDRAFLYRDPLSR